MKHLYRLIFLIWPVVSLVSTSTTQAQDVRVRLLDLNEPTEIVLSAHDGPMALFAGRHAAPLTRLDAGSSVRIERSNQQLHLQVDGLALYADSLRVEPSDGAHVGIAVAQGTERLPVRRYTGRLEVAPDDAEWALKLINEVPLEDYVASVVASEYGFDDLEGSKAMAVLVRTYTLAAIGKFGSEYDHVDHTLSQVYRGVEAVTPTSMEAARRTAGEVLTHEGELIRAVYFSTSGGITADNEDVWAGNALPYLRGKTDPYGGESPHARWTTRLSRPRLLAELRRQYGNDIDGFLIDERSEDGRVSSIALVRVDGSRRGISANDFRLLVTRHFGARAVRSALFDARRDGDEYVFDGRGFGHGVGLSQWGAHDMAQRGMSYESILSFYYTGVALAHLNETAPPSEPPIRAVSVPDLPGDSDPEQRRIGW